MYGNYAGDVMNFDMAAEMAAMEDIEVRTVLTTDDVASAPRGPAGEAARGGGELLHLQGGRRGLRPVLTLDEVERVARKANDRTFTMGVALAPCSLPQTRRPNFEIGDDEMEIGMGIHGEPGVARGPLKPADAIVDEMMDRILGEMGAARGRPGGGAGQRAGVDAADGALHHEPAGAAAAGRGRGRRCMRPGSATGAPRWRWPARR